MKVSNITGYKRVNFCAKNNFKKAREIQHRTQQSALDKEEIKASNSQMLKYLNCQFDDLNQIAPEVLHLEDFDTIVRFCELKNGSFSRKLTDDEAWLLARPFSIKYADLQETTQGVYLIEEKAKIDVELRKNLPTRRFNNEEVQKFINYKENKNFDSTSQIMRTIELESDNNGFKRKLSTQEAFYFGKKCAQFEEIEDYINHIENNPEVKKIYDTLEDKNWRLTYRTLQTNGQKELRFEIKKDNLIIIYTFRNGKIFNITKQINSDILGGFEGFDTTKRTTTFLENSTIPYKNNNAIYPKELIEILNDENGVVERIVKTTLDDTFCLPNSKIWILSNWSEDLDMLNLIKKDLIKPDITTTSISEDNGETKVLQVFDLKTAKITKEHSANKNNTELNLTIEDKSGNVLYKTKRTHEKIGQNITRTTVNGAKYVIHFNDTDKTARVMHKNKVQILEEIIGDDLILDDNIEDNETLKTKLWDFCKDKLPADILLILHILNCKLYPTTNELDSNYNELYNNIFSGDNLGILSHEIGHLLSRCHGAITDYLLSQDENLARIYQEELNEINKTNSGFINRHILDYFNETGSNKDLQKENDTTQARSKENLERLSTSTGLEEIVAESMMIKTTLHASNPVVELRTHFLMQNFPKTIAYCCNLLDEFEEALLNIVF